MLVLVPKVLEIPIAPPLVVALFSEKLQFVIVALKTPNHVFMLIAPPLFALFPEKLQFVMLGLLVPEPAP